MRLDIAKKRNVLIIRVETTNEMERIYNPFKKCIIRKLREINRTSERTERSNKNKVSDGFYNKRI
jgi:hypothetical protein